MKESPREKLVAIRDRLDSRYRAGTHTAGKLIMEACEAMTALSSELSSVSVRFPLARCAEIAQDVAAEFYGVRAADLIGKGKHAAIVAARNVAMYLTRECARASTLSEIGAHFGGRHHSTVIYALKQVRDRRATNPGYARMLDSWVKEVQMAEVEAEKASLAVAMAKVAKGASAAEEAVKAVGLKPEREVA